MRREKKEEQPCYINRLFDKIFLDRVWSHRAPALATIAQAFPAQQEALFRLFVEHFDKIVLDCVWSDRAPALATIARAFPDQQEALFRLFAEHFDKIVLDCVWSDRAPALATIARAFPDQRYAHILGLPPKEMKTYFRKVSESEIRKNSRILAQGSRDIREERFSLFKTLPKEVCVKIASLTGNPRDHDEKSSEEVAYSAFGKHVEDRACKAPINALDLIESFPGLTYRRIKRAVSRLMTDEGVLCCSA
jgi:hypothetical protein